MATFFSTSFFNFQTKSERGEEKTVTKWIWVYWVVTVLLTGLVIGAWWWNRRWTEKKRRLSKEEDGGIAAQNDGGISSNAHSTKPSLTQHGHNRKELNRMFCDKRSST